MAGSSIRSMVCRLANAATVAALLSTFGSTEVSTQAFAQAMAMPPDCAQDLNKCSVQVWPVNAFPHRGVEWSYTFSNGKVLTCTSNGRHTLRTCTLEDAVTGPSSTNIDASDPAVRLQCADLKQQLRELNGIQSNPQTSVGLEREFLRGAMQMTPAQLDQEIANLRDDLNLKKNPPAATSPRATDTNANGALRLSELEYRQIDTESQELKFLMDLRANQAIGPELGATPQQMQDRANRMVNEQQSWAEGMQDVYDHEIKNLNDQLGSLKCDSVPVPGNPLSH